MQAIPEAPDLRAFDPLASVFVSANAGAGKTSLLANRVLALLLSGVEPSRILCLTFTNAAAAEMSNRVLKELGTWVMADSDTLVNAICALTGHAPDDIILRRARGLFARVLEAPEGIRIQTIHGFCQSLLKRFPLEAGISPHFTVMDGRTEQEMLKEARLRLWSNAEEADPKLREAIYALAHDLSESPLHELLSEIVQRKRSFRALFQKTHGVEMAVHSIWQRFGVDSAMTREQLMSECMQYDEPRASGLRSITQALMTGAATDQKTAQGMARWLELKKKNSDEAERYAQIFVTNEGTKRKRLFTQKTLADQELIDLLLDEQERVYRFSNACRALSIAERSEYVLHVAEALLSLYDQLKRAHARMDYDDLILTANDLLARPGISPWVLYKLDGGIDQVLVDEAQDTSPEQWSIVSALTEDFFAGDSRAQTPRSLFIVGDEKQSIFSFQGADVAALGKMQRHFSGRITDVAGVAHHIALTKSYRSTPEILQAVDAVFGRPEAADGLMFEVKELMHVATRSHPGLVELWPLIAPSEEETSHPAALLTRQLADTIQGWLKDGLYLPSKGRAVEPGDIMILLRTRTALAQRLTRALKRRNVPVAGVDRMILTDNLAVKDLIALGNVLLLPEDDLTLAALLKSPIGNVSEEQLFDLAWNRGDRSLWDRLRESKPLREVYELLTDLRARADYTAPFELYSHVLETLGMRRRFTGRMGEEYHDAIDEFLNQALEYERAHTPSLQGFLHWLVASESEIKRDMEQAKNCVRIMTVHGAKGLQAPVVIVPDTVSLPSLDDALLWHDDERTVVPMIPRGSKRDDEVARNLREQRKAAMLAEYRRQLYVALTRAEDMLYICGASKDEAGEESWYHLVREGLASVATPFDMKHGQGLRVGKAAERSGKSKAKKTTATSQKEFAFLASPPPAEPAPPKPLVPSRLPLDETPLASPLADTDLYRRGSLIHMLLQYLPAVVPSERTRKAEKLVQSYKDGLSADALQACIKEALAVMEDKRFAYLFGADALAEVPVAGTVKIAGKPVAVAGQIDRLHVGENEVTIVDFKTGRRPPATQGATPIPYLRQMLLYKLLLQAIYPEKTVRCALLWTSIPKIDVLDDALLDETLASSYI